MQWQLAFTYYWELGKKLLIRMRPLTQELISSYTMPQSVLLCVCSVKHWINIIDECAFHRFKLQLKSQCKMPVATSPPGVNFKKKICRLFILAWKCLKHCFGDEYLSICCPLCHFCCPFRHFHHQFEHFQSQIYFIKLNMENTIMFWYFDIRLFKN